MANVNNPTLQFRTAFAVFWLVRERSKVGIEQEVGGGGNTAKTREGATLVPRSCTRTLLAKKGNKKVYRYFN